MEVGPLRLLAEALFLSFLLVWLSERLLWSIYDPRRYLSLLAEAAGLVEKIEALRRERDRRAERKRAMLEARLAPIRSALLRVSLLRGVLYTAAYIACAASLSVTNPVYYPAPAPIPLLTIVYHGKAYYGAPQIAMLSVLAAIMVLMGPGRLRTVARGG